MPRMPTEDDLASPQIRSRAVPSRRQDFVGPAIARAGNVVTANADADADQDLRFSRRDKAENDAMDLARARADWNTRRMTADERYTLEKNPAYDKWEKGYSGEITKHRDAAASKIRDPKLREKFILDTEDDITGGTFRVRERAGGIDRDKRRAEAIASIEQNLNIAAAPGMDPKEAEKIIAKARADIDNFAMSGLFTPAQAVEARRNFAKRYASLKIAQDIQADPEAAYQNLRGDPGEIYFKKLEMKESGGRDNAKAPTSSATGRHQFTESTWDAVRRAHPELNLTADGRTNRDQSNRAVRAFTADNARGLKEAGIPVNEASLYLAHFMGLGGATRMLKADPGANAAALFPEAARANSTIFYTKDGKARSVGEVIAIQTKGFRGGNSGPVPEYYTVLDPEDRARFESAAEGEWTSRAKEQQDVTALQRYQMKSAIEDDIAQITETGKAADIEPQTVVDTLGETEAAKWLENRDVAVKTYEAVAGMDNMTDEQISQHLDSLEPQTGTEGFANAQKVYEKAESRARELRDLRLKDPAKAVEDSTIVQSAMAQVKLDDPLAPAKLAKARLAAQDAIGIPTAMQQPITRAEARTIIAPIQMVLDQMDAQIGAAAGQGADSATRRANAKAARAAAEQQLRATVQEIEAKYGPYAQKVLAFAISESVRDKEIGDMASGIFRKIARGEKPTVAETKGLEDVNDASIAEKAVTGQLPKPDKPTGKEGLQVGAPKPAQRAPAPNRSGQPMGKAPEKQGVYAQPSARAIDRLLANPGEAALFDGVYGPGAAAKWLKKE